jgi:DNA polymerase-3 subunit gamma/tau
VGRDLPLDTLQAVADEDAAAAFVLAGRAVELGYDLRLVCRELARAVRDLLVLSVDRSRIDDPEIAGEGERERLLALVPRFSREDLLRAFDLLTRAEADIRTAAQPRYHLEMALLRWIHLRKLTPIEDLIASLGAGGSAPGVTAAVPRITSARPVVPLAAATTVAAPRQAVPVSRPPLPPAPPAPPSPRSGAAVAAAKPPQSPPPQRSSPPEPVSDARFKDTWLAEIRKGKMVFYSTVVAQAQKIEVASTGITFTFAEGQRTLRDMFEQNKAWLETLAQQLSGRRIPVVSATLEAGATVVQKTPEAVATEDKKAALKERAMADAGVQALLEVFPAEIRDVEEM